MTQSEFIKYIIKNYCPHDIFRGMEPNTKRCDRLTNDYKELNCNFCWVLTIMEREGNDNEETGDTML